jgi:hypothetical protein
MAMATATREVRMGRAHVGRMRRLIKAIAESGPPVCNGSTWCGYCAAVPGELHRRSCLWLRAHRLWFDVRDEGDEVGDHA